MKIQISTDEHNFRICLPNGLIFNRLTAFICIAVIKKHAPGHDLSSDQLNTLFAELRRIKAKYGNLELVDVEASDGQIVKIIL